MTPEQRIAAIETAGWPLAYDGCHKIYFLQDDEREADARDIGYDIHPATSLRALIEESCPLVFVSRWGWDNDDFDHKWNINQFEMETL